MIHFDFLLTALNAWYGSDKLPEQKGGVNASLTNNYDGKRFVKHSAHINLEICHQTGKIHNYLYFNHNFF